MPRTGTADLIRRAFLSKKTITLDELYKLVKNENEDDFKYTISKHRIRSTVFSMTKQGEIKRIGNSMYKKV